MVQLTVQLTDDLAGRCKAVGPWLSAIIELSLAGFKTSAAATAAEVIGFLCTNPAPDATAAFHVSDEAQARLQRLLTLNEAGLLSLSEQAELDELQRLEQLVVILKIEAATFGDAAQ